jgi:membrane protein
MSKEETLRTRIWQGGELPGFTGFSMRLLRIGVLIIESFKRNAMTGRAAALAFISTLAFVPAMAVVFMILGVFGALETIHSEVREFALRTLAPGTNVIEKLDALFAQLGATPVGLSSLLVLVALAFWVLIVLERTLNALWGIRRPRSVVRRTMVYWTMLTAGSLGLAISLGPTPFLMSGGLMGWLEKSAPLLSQPVLIIVPFVTTCAVLSLVFLFTPSTYVPVRAAIIGGIAGGILWEGLKLGSLNVGAGVLTEALPYGAIVAGPVFLLWIHLGWVMVLLGAGVAYGVQHANTQRRELDLPPASQQLKERLALRATLLVSRSFIAGTDAPNIEDLARSLNVPLRLVSQVVYQLMIAGVLRELARSEKRGSGVVPASDPQRITVQDVLDAVRSYGVNAGQFPDDVQGDEIENVVADAWDKASKGLVRVNFRDLAESPTTETAVRKRA